MPKSRNKSKLYMKNKNNLKARIKGIEGKLTIYKRNSRQRISK